MLPETLSISYRWDILQVSRLGCRMLVENVPLRLSVAARNGPAAQRVFGRAAYRQRLIDLLDRLQLSSEPRIRVVHGSGEERYELRGWQLRPFPSGEAQARAGFSAEPEQRLPDAVIAMLGRGEPIGSEQEPAAHPPAPAARRRIIRGRRRHVRCGRSREQAEAGAIGQESITSALVAPGEGSPGEGAPGEGSPGEAADREGPRCQGSPCEAYRPAAERSRLASQRAAPQGRSLMPCSPFSELEVDMAHRNGCQIGLSGYR